MTDTAWIENALTSARPQAVGALLRYFRNLDTAEEAYQNACLRALKTWPENGPPRDRRGVADHGRAQRRDRRGAAPSQAGSLARRAGDLRSRRRRGCAGRTARRLALPRRHSCGCCSSAVIRTCRRRSRSRWRCASSPASPSSRSRAPFWSAKPRWSSASPVRKRASPKPTCRSKRRARSSAPSGSCRSRR